MFLKLAMPQVSRMVDATIVDRWLVAPGDHVAPGDDIVQVRVGEITRMKHANPQRLRRRARRKGAETTSFREVTYLVRVTAVDQGMVARIVAPEGSEAATGAVLAVLATGAEDGEPPGDATELSTFRVVANPVEPEAQ